MTWKRVKLKSLLSQPVQNGYSPVCSERPNGKWVLGLGALNGSGLDVAQVKPAPINNKRVDDFLLRSGDFLVSRSNTLDKVGRAALFKGQIKNCSYPDLMMRFRVKESRIYPEFLEIYLRSSEAVRHFQRSASGTSDSMVKINKSVVENLLIPQPPFDQQIAIASLITVWDVAINKTKHLILQKRKLKKGRVQELIASKNPNTKIGEFVKSVVRAAKKPEAAYLALGIRSHFKGTFHRFVEDPQSVNMDTLYKVKRDDLIVNITFAWEGAITLANAEDEECYVSHRFPTYELDPDKADATFVRQLICSGKMKYELRNISPGGAGRNRVLNKKDFLQLEVWLPSLLVQQKIGSEMGLLDKEILFLEQILGKYEEQKRGLMQKLLAGEWRVKTKEDAA